MSEINGNKGKRVSYFMGLSLGVHGCVIFFFCWLWAMVWCFGCVLGCFQPAGLKRARVPPANPCWKAVFHCLSRRKIAKRLPAKLSHVFFQVSILEKLARVVKPCESCLVDHVLGRAAVLNWIQPVVCTDSVARRFSVSIFRTPALGWWVITPPSSRPLTSPELPTHHIEAQFRFTNEEWSAFCLTQLHAEPTIVCQCCLCTVQEWAVLWSHQSLSSKVRLVSNIWNGSHQASRFRIRHHQRRPCASSAFLLILFHPLCVLLSQCCGCSFPGPPLKLLESVRLCFRWHFSGKVFSAHCLARP